MSLEDPLHSSSGDGIHLSMRQTATLVDAVAGMVLDVQDNSAKHSQLGFRALMPMVESIIAEDVLYHSTSQRVGWSPSSPDHASSGQEHLKGPRSEQDGAVGALAYVLFTSGSTGKPKGVMIEHSSMVPFLHMHTTEKLPGLLSSDRVLYTFAMTFDPSVFVVWSTLLASATIVIAHSSTDATDPTYLSTLISHEGVTFVSMAPTPLALLLSMAPLPQSVKAVLLGGEALPTELGLRLLATGVRVLNAYGPCEVTIQSNIFELELDAVGVPNFQGTVPIGPVVSNTRGYVLDSGGGTVPIGVAGELYLGGPKVARGYIGRDDLTNAAFVNVASLPNTGRLYKTGDRVRWLPDGNLEFLGRVDFQIKLHGQRIEAGEIEVVLRSVTNVEDAVVMAEHSPSGLATLVGYIISADVSIPSAFQTARAALPAYMVPSEILALSEWPLNSSGKVDRSRLRHLRAESLKESQQSSALGVQHLSVEEEHVVAVCLSVLGVVVADRNAALGFNSLHAVLIRSQLSARGFPTPSLYDILMSPSVAELTQLITTNMAPSLTVTKLPHLMQSLYAPPASSSPCLPPLFLVAPALGFSACYARLAARVGDAPRAVWGLDNGPMMDIMAMAEHHASCIEVLSPDGPLHLGGWSLGGTVATLIAGILQRKGREVRCVIVLDAADPLEFGDGMSEGDAEHGFTAAGVGQLCTQGAAQVLFFYATLDDDGCVKPGKTHWQPPAAVLRVLDVHCRHDDMLDLESSFNVIAGAMIEHLAKWDQASGAKSVAMLVDCLEEQHELRSQLSVFSHQRECGVGSK